MRKYLAAGRNAVAVAIFATAFTIGSTDSAAAQSATAERAPITVTMRLPSRAAKVAFNWHANAPKRQVSASAQASILHAATKVGRTGASWVCSPAGYGRKSSCYRN